MIRIPLRPCTTLDPRDERSSAERPLLDAVNIPADQIADRSHELPAAGRPVRVAESGPATDRACEILSRIGRETLCVAAITVDATDAGERSIGRLWSPTPMLVEHADALVPPPDGAALDLACGSGRDAIFLASLGWRVTGVDILPDALARGCALARRCADAIEPVEWQPVDLEREPLKELSAAWQSRYDLITVFRFLHRPLAPHLARWLRPGGRVLYETFTTLHRARHGRPSRDAHVLAPGELAALLADFDLDSCDEAWRGDAHTARAIARRG